MNKSKKIILVIAIAIFVIIIVTLSQSSILKVFFKIDYTEYIYKYGEEYNIDPMLIAAIINVESEYNRNIKSRSGAMGLMQLMEETALEEADEVGENIIVTEKLYNPEVNIKIGTKYIAKLIKKYDNLYLALAAYNAGMGNVDRWIEEGIIKKDGTDIENIPLKETNNYVRKILRDYKIYKYLYENK